MKVKNPVSQNIIIFPKIKKGFVKQKFKFFMYLCTQHLVGDHIGEVWHGSDRPVHC